MFSYHLLEVGYLQGVSWLIKKPKLEGIPGLIAIEWMNMMTLGAHIFSPKRITPKYIAVFAQWEIGRAHV